MTETTPESSKYHVQINQAQGLVIGDNACVEQNFYSSPPPPPPASRDELLTAIRQANAELRTYRNEIASIHLERAEVAQIVEWALTGDPKHRLGMLLDQPGGGKSVVMRDALAQLEAKGIPTLAIKADSLSGVRDRADLANRLALPASVEECIQYLASEGPVVVILDQLDALSLTLSRDQSTLDVMLGTLARLRELERVRIVASCRTFDLNNDPRLSTIKVDQRFELRLLNEEQVNQVLRAIGIDPPRLLPAHRVLLTVPLHLDIYARVVVGTVPSSTPESFGTLQDLYAALWQRWIEAAVPDAPSLTERIAAVYRLVDTMQTNRQPIAPEALLDEQREAAGYLERVGFIRREKGNWLFLHQTLFDYCYARRFVAQGRSLSREILSGSQGLFERSQMVQILAFLRGTNETAYRRELGRLLFADDLRVHLRLLLLGWFGSLPNPTTDELQIARRLMGDADSRLRFLQAIGGNEGWFDLLNAQIVPSLLRADDDRLVETIVLYLSTLISRSDVVLAQLRPYLDQSETWDARISYCLARLKSWQSDEALDMLCDLISRNRTAGQEEICFFNLAETNPAAGCRILRAYLDRRLDDLIAQDRAESRVAKSCPDTISRIGLRDRFTWNQRLLGEYAIGEIIQRAAQNCPGAIIEHLLPWFLCATVLLAEPRNKRDDYPSDPLFAWGWSGEHPSEGTLFARRICEALNHLAQTKPQDFRELATRLAEIETLAVQRVLAQAYLSSPEEYADDIFEYLMADPRRLDIGEHLEDPHYDSCRLYSAAFRHMDEHRRVALEQLILNLQPAWERRTRQNRDATGITQFRFLKTVEANLLSATARRRLRELERKFPGFELHLPQGVIWRSVGPPIEQSAQAKMSDEAWLGAMRKYDDSTEWGAPRKVPLKGGVIELSRAFAEQVKEDPKRFYRLAQRFDETIPLYYVVAAISSLAESYAPAEWVFDLVRQFTPRIKDDFRRSICGAIEKRAEDGVPDDLLDLMTDWALHDPDPNKELWCVLASDGQPHFSGDPHSHGINTNRGAILRIACHCARQRKPPQVERAFQLLEQSADDPSTAVRTCVVESLGPLLKGDDARALAIFERIVEGHSVLLRSPLVHEFLYWTYYRHFPRIRPYIEALLTDAGEDTRQAGARLACLAAFRYPEAADLAGQAMRADVVMRRGAAQIYARNLEYSNLQATCHKRLRELMHDPDKQVRAHVGECFDYLGPEHLNTLRSFVEEFLASPSLLDGAEHLIKYLAPLAADEHDLALRVTSRILDAAGADAVDIRTSRAIMERDLVRLPLAVYTHADDPATESDAMGLFERLLLMGSREAQRALSDWDRR
jgi:hypothetical protein